MALRAAKSSCSLRSLFLRVSFSSGFTPWTDHRNMVAKSNVRKNQSHHATKVVEVKRNKMHLFKNELIKICRFELVWYSTTRTQKCLPSVHIAIRPVCRGVVCI